MKLNNLFLYVGIQKTASSSIQETLFQNRDLLGENNFLYPKNWTKWHVSEIGALMYKEKEEERRNILHRANFTQLDRDNIINRLKEEIKVSNCENLILSAESIILYSSNGLKELKRIINEELSINKIKIVISTRNPIDFMNSFSQQLIKSSFKSSIEKLEERLHYKTQIIKFEEIFGKENIILYSFEEAKKNKNGIMGQFLEKINFPKDKIKEIKVYKQNEGISDISCDLIEYINQKEPFIVNNEISKNRKIGDTRLLHTLSGNKYVIEESEQKQICKEIIDDILWLKSNYNIDYTDMKYIQKPIIKFTNSNISEIEKIYLKLNKNIQNYIGKYFFDKLKKTKIYDIKSQIILRKILKTIKNQKGVDVGTI
ncbi:hypothetical protein DF188_05880 [Aliarcobacter skirrowii]|uniref:Sulfotransferase domain-containing protein n=1 Tax=Aliarcobacter skirrowii TaxID=28200 RepID=A0A2U2C195_9BACT|nr:hypothetical protein [Aliarcobacter skirrowii]PWE21741.1 hypothetical protein DF188_05880 [Aliarcobacter skirrowii]